MANLNTVVPVNAATAADAWSAIKQEFANHQWTVEGYGEVVNVEPEVRPFNEVAIECEGATQCFLIRVRVSK